MVRVLFAAAALGAFCAGCPGNGLDVPWQEEPTPTPTATPSPTPTPGPTDWWDAGYAYRRPITIDPTTPPGYTVQVAIDHSASVNAGTSLPSGADVRIVAWDGTQYLELDRVLADGTTWNTVDTRLWVQIPDGAWSLFVYYGNPSATAPPEDETGVFLLAEGFEGGALGDWTARLGSAVAVESGAARTGNFALSFSETTQSNTWVTTNNVNVADVSVEAWWYLEGSVSYDVAQGVRTGSGGVIDQYETNIEGSNGWLISTMVNGSFTGVSGHNGNPVADTWIKVVTEAVGTEVRVTIDDVPIVAQEWLDVGNDLASGGVGFRGFDVPMGSHWRVDDVRVRMRQKPEPATGLGAEETAPSL